MNGFQIYLLRDRLYCGFQRHSQDGLLISEAEYVRPPARRHFSPKNKRKRPILFFPLSFSYPLFSIPPIMMSFWKEIHIQVSSINKQDIFPQLPTPSLLNSKFPFLPPFVEAMTQRALPRLKYPGCVKCSYQIKTQDSSLIHKELLIS